jgi:SAM-dependent methyltransferase
MTYVMESEQELARLTAQGEADPVRERLLATGLRAGHVALDAGCGPGVVSRVLAELVGPAGRIVGIDLSHERIQEARRRAEGLSQLSFRESDVHNTGFEDESFDFVWSQFVFEYLSRPDLALQELVRVTRRGGKLVISDIDGAGLANWPFPIDLQHKVARLFDALRVTGFDVHAGRKMFHLFRSSGLTDVKVHVFPFYVIAGRADERTLIDWQVRFATAERVAAPAFGGVGPWRQFRDEYLALMNDPDTLKYAVVLVTEGVRP